MTTSTRSAAATGLPPFHSAIPAAVQRRGFLRSLAALPFVGGASLTPAALLDSEEGPNAPKRPATLDDYAAADFPALEVDLGEARGAHSSMWTPLAISLTLLTKSPDGCRDLAARMEDGEADADVMVTSIRDGAAWFRQAAELMESAEARFLCGAARLIKEEL